MQYTSCEGMQLNGSTSFTLWSRTSFRHLVAITWLLFLAVATTRSAAQVQPSGEVNTYEAQNGNITMALIGDSVVTRPDS